MNEKLTKANIEKAYNPCALDSRYPWQVVCSSSVGKVTLPFSSRIGARAVANYINANGVMPTAYGDELANRVMAFEEAGDRDVWVPASGGLESPCMRRGRRVLYCWNPARREHCYIDLETDMPIED